AGAGLNCGHAVHAGGCGATPARRPRPHGVLVALTVHGRASDEGRLGRPRWCRVLRVAVSVPKVHRNLNGGDPGESRPQLLILAFPSPHLRYLPCSEAVARNNAADAT